jgi:hypothetical protein
MVAGVIVADLRSESDVPPEGEIVAINFIPLREGVSVDEFAHFSSTLDQPLCLSQDVVLSFDAYRIVGGERGTQHFDVLEVMCLRSWAEWEHVRDGLADLLPVTSRFDELVDSSQVRTVFATKIERPTS